MAVASRSRATLAAKQGDVKKAEERYFQSIAMFKHLEDEPSISVTRRMLGDLYIRKGEPGKARAEFIEALNTARRRDWKPVIADCYKGLGDAARLERNLTDARGWYEEALKICEGLNDDERLSRIRKKLELL